MRLWEILQEEATAGSTSAGSIATVVSPHLAIGNKKTRNRYGKGGKPRPPKQNKRKTKTEQRKMHLI